MAAITLQSMAGHKIKRSKIFNRIGVAEGRGGQKFKGMRLFIILS